ERGADPNITNNRGRSPLHEALSTEAAELLIRHGAEVNKPDVAKKAPLFVATERDSRDVIKVLLSNRADPNSIAKRGRSPLHEARSGEAAEILIKYKAKINARTSSGETPLLLATKEDRKPVIQVLLDKGADAKIPGPFKRFPIHEVQSPEAAMSLIGKTVNINEGDENGETPLFVAVKANRRDVADVLLVKGAADPNISNSDEQSPLHQAQSEEMVDLLIKYQAEVNVRDVQGETPLFAASRLGRVSVLKKLLLNKGDPDVRDYSLQTPLLVASQNGHLCVVQVLLENGVNPNIPDDSLRTPLFVAKSAETAKLLVKKGANVNCIDKKGETALHSFCRGGREDVAKQLLSEGARCDIKNKKQQTAFVIAISKGYLRIASQFLASILNSAESRLEQEFEILSEIGEGGYGKVYKVKKKTDGEEYALKCVTISGDSEKMQRSLREVRAAMQLGGAFIVRCYDAWIEEGHVDEKVIKSQTEPVVGDKTPK
ncbi:unnamed protein product, partial [Cyprideis torosa]